MGTIIKGQWHIDEPKPETSEGEFVRAESSCRQPISSDNNAIFPAEKGRYHLYVSYACPWAHRTIIFRALKKLDSIISLSTVHPYADKMGWAFAKNQEKALDPLTGLRYIHELYIQHDAKYTGRATVPVLWDKKTKTIINNESVDIIRMLNSAFNTYTDDATDYYPTELRPQIDEINQFVYENINNGVYQCGFATTQLAYEQAFDNLFSALDSLDKRLSQQAYLVGDKLTEADWRLFTTLVRFDTVYYTLFKCNQQRIADYPNLYRYVQRLYQIPGIADTVHMNEIKQHYFQSMTDLNPNQIVPKGPLLDYLT